MTSSTTRRLPIALSLPIALLCGLFLAGCLEETYEPGNLDGSSKDAAYEDCSGDDDCADPDDKAAQGWDWGDVAAPDSTASIWGDPHAKAPGSTSSVRGDPHAKCTECKKTTADR